MDQSDLPLLGAMSTLFFFSSSASFITLLSYDPLWETSLSLGDSRGFLSIILISFTWINLSLRFSRPLSIHVFPTMPYVNVREVLEQRSGNPCRVCPQGKTEAGGIVSAFHFPNGTGSDYEWRDR